VDGDFNGGGQPGDRQELQQLRQTNRASIMGVSGSRPALSGADPAADRIYGMASG
jgi:hypothetical protein